MRGVQQSRDVGKCKGPEAGEYPACLRPVRRAGEEEENRLRGGRRWRWNRGGQRSGRVLTDILKISGSMLRWKGISVRL